MTHSPKVISISSVSLNNNQNKKEDTDYIYDSLNNVTKLSLYVFGASAVILATMTVSNIENELTQSAKRLFLTSAVVHILGYVSRNFYENIIVPALPEEE